MHSGHRPDDLFRYSRVPYSARATRPADARVIGKIKARGMRRRAVTLRVGVNGFGRIGRNFWRAIKAGGHDIEIVAFNDLGEVPTMAHLLKYDSVFGRLPYDVSASADGIVVDGKTIKGFAERAPGKLPW